MDDERLNRSIQQDEQHFWKGRSGKHWREVIRCSRWTLAHVDLFFPKAAGHRTLSDTNRHSGSARGDATGDRNSCAILIRNSSFSTPSTACASTERWSDGGGTTGFAAGCETSYTEIYPSTRYTFLPDAEPQKLARRQNAHSSGTFRANSRGKRRAKWYVRVAEWTRDRIYTPQEDTL